MTLLLCPECCQWREPTAGRCPVCAGTLDLAVPDPATDVIANEIGDLQGLLGLAEISRTRLPKHGQLWATTHGLLFVPHESRVIEFPSHNVSPATPAPSALPQEESDGRRQGRWISRLWTRLTRQSLASRFACERRTDHLPSHDRLTLAELLRSDPGVLFWSRAGIALWRRQQREWELIRLDAQVWPERIAMRDRDGDRALLTWLESTACPLPANVR